MEEELYQVLKKVFDQTEGPFDDPVISDELYSEMEDVLNKYKAKKNEGPIDDMR